MWRGLAAAGAAAFLLVGCTAVWHGEIRVEAAGMDAGAARDLAWRMTGAEAAPSLCTPTTCSGDEPVGTVYFETERLYYRLETSSAPDGARIVYRMSTEAGAPEQARRGKREALALAERLRRRFGADRVAICGTGLRSCEAG